MTTQTQLKRKPGLAAFWGFLLGLGIVIYLIFVFPVIGLDSVASVAIKAALIIAGVMVLSVLWGLFAPAKKPKGTPPPAYDEAPPAAPVEEEPPPIPASMDDDEEPVT